MKKELLGFKLKTWAWLGFLVLALIFTGKRLALARATPNRLKFAHTMTTESEQAILREAITEFERSHPGVVIEQIVSNSEVYNTVGWRLQFQGRNQPDIYFHWQGFKVEYCIDNGWAMDLTPFLSRGFLDQFLPSTVVKQRGGTYFLPHSVDVCNLVWYNRQILDRLNLREPSTLNHWLALCRKLRDANILALAQGNRDLWPMGNLAMELLGKSLGPATADTLFQPAIAIQPRDLQGMESLTWLLTNGCFDLPGVLNPGAVGSLSDIDAKVLFLSGKSGQHILGSWFLADIQDAQSRNELKFDIGVFGVPSQEGRSNVMAMVSTGFLVNPRTKNPRASVEFVELLLSKQYQSAFAKLGNLSARLDAADFTDHPLAKRMLEIRSGTLSLVPPPDTGFRPDQAAAFYDVCGKLIDKGLDSSQAAALWSREKEHLARKGL
ncbi:MAG TPA: extracellular solute-binding protein [Candidatus Nitrosotalea sp.]|nr:extracellular solute-binding protein [Candidatus Nitrosotalea sp.]